MRMPSFLLSSLLAAGCAGPVAGHYQGVCEVVHDGLLDEYDFRLTIPMAVELTAVSDVWGEGDGTFSLPGQSGAGPAILDARKLGYGDDLVAGLVIQDDASDGELWAHLRFERDTETWVGECGYAQYGTVEDVDCADTEMLGIPWAVCSTTDAVWDGSPDSVEPFADEAVLEGQIELTRATDALPAAEGDPIEPDPCRFEQADADACFDVRVRGRGSSYRRIEAYDDDGRVTAFAQGGGAGDWEVAGFYTWSDSGRSADVEGASCQEGGSIEEEWHFDESGYETRYEQHAGYDSIRCSISTEVVDGARVSATWRCSETCTVSSGEGPYEYTEEISYGADGRPETVTHSGVSCLGVEVDYSDELTWEEC